MSMRDEDFELLAACIRRIRSEVQTDLDLSFAADGAIVIAGLAERVAEDFAARYRRFSRDAFLAACQSGNAMSVSPTARPANRTSVFAS